MRLSKRLPGLDLVVVALGWMPKPTADSRPLDVFGVCQSAVGQTSHLLGVLSHGSRQPPATLTSLDDQPIKDRRPDA